MTGIIGNMVLVSSGFHTRKNFSENFLQLGHVSSKVIASLVLGRKCLKNIRLKGAKLLACPWRPHLSGRAWLGGPRCKLGTLEERNLSPTRNLTTVPWLPSQWPNHYTGYANPKLLPFVSFIYSMYKGKQKIKR